jgi:tetratricopeptide (TPR) repeat protein
MNSSRLNQLLKFWEESPDDPFICYALALEYKVADPEQTLRLFNHLLEKHPDYLPTYYQVALFHEEKGRVKEALKLYQQGIELAVKQNDTGTLKELRAAYAMLADE